MTNLITDGLDWFPSGQNTATRQMLFAANSWYPYGRTSSAPANVVPGFFNFGKALEWATTAGFPSGAWFTDGYVIPIGVDLTEGFFGFHFFRYPDNTFQMAGMIAVFDAVNNQCQFSITFEDYGIIKVWRGFRSNAGSSANFLGSSAVGAYQENEVFHVEVRFKVDDTNGEVEVRINTVQKVSIVASDTRGSTGATTADSLWIGGMVQVASGALCHYALDNLFFNDTTGTTNNDWLGNVRVKTQFMIADGPHISFSIGGTSPAASNWQSVQNTLLDGTKFVYSGTVGDYDLYEPDPILNAPLVHCLQLRGALWQDDATQRIARYLVQIAGTNYDAPTDFYTNQTPTFYKDRLETNPATSAGWTGADVNGLYAGVKVEG